MPSEEQSSERVVSIKRQPGGGLGISVKGGAEHGIPVLISRVFTGQTDDSKDKLHPGDAILAINGKRVDHMLHDDVVKELRTCGSHVSLTVSSFDGANHLLSPGKKTASPLQNVANSQYEDSIDSSHFSSSQSANVSLNADTVSSPVVKKEVEQPSMNISTRLESAVTHFPFKELTIPLLFSRIEQYFGGNTNIREHSFEILSNNNLSSGVISCSNKDEMKDWITAVSEAINNAAERHISNLCKDLSCDNIIQMGWIDEKNEMQSTWKHSFLILTDNELRFFKSPPMTKEDWRTCERACNVCEVLCRFWEKPSADSRNFCFRFQEGSEQPLFCSVSTEADLNRWKNNIEKATFDFARKQQMASYPCESEGRQCEFVVSLDQGFKMFDSNTKEELWSYRFSQLKSSSDDQQCNITFSFHNRTTNQIDQKSFSCVRAYQLLFCVHSFLATKLSMVDPTFLEKVTAHAQPGTHHSDQSRRTTNRNTRDSS